MIKYNNINIYIQLKWKIYFKIEDVVDAFLVIDILESNCDSDFVTMYNFSSEFIFVCP